MKPTNCQALVARLHKVIVRKNTLWLRELNTRKSAKDAWTKVREITRGSGRTSRGLVESLTAEMFNAHYASISISATFKPKIVDGRCPFSFPSLPFPFPFAPLLPFPSVLPLSLPAPFPCPPLSSPLPLPSA